MTTKEIIHKINEQLHYGDKIELAVRTGLHKLTINRFFNGKDEELVEDTHNKIMDAALTIIEERQKREKKLVKKLNSILG